MVVQREVWQVVHREVIKEDVAVRHPIPSECTEVPVDAGHAAAAAVPVISCRGDGVGTGSFSLKSLASAAL